MINNIQPINFNRTNNSKLAVRPSMAMKSDNVSFCGVADKAYTALTRTRNAKDAEELSQLLFSSTEHSLMLGKTQKAKQSWFSRMYEKIFQKVYNNTEKSAVSLDTVYVDVIKDSNGKVVAGSSMIVEPDKFVSHVNHVVLAPELKGTRKGKQMLLDMADRIVENTEKNNAFEITWAVGGPDKAYNKMMSRIPHVKEVLPFSRLTEYSVFVDDLKKVIDKVKSK